MNLKQTVKIQVIKTLFAPKLLLLCVLMEYMNVTMGPLNLVY
jgi:hypothetical protein